MARRVYRVYQPPRCDPLGYGLFLQTDRIARDPQSQLLASVQIRDQQTSTVLLFEGRLTLSSSRARLRFLQALLHVTEMLGTDDLPVLAIALTNIALALETDLKETLGDAPIALPDARELWALAAPLAHAPDLLDQMADVLEQRGLIGEREPSQLLYLAATARLLPRPVNIILKASSSTGKSFLLHRVLDLLPPSAYENFTSISPRFLSYYRRELRHRIVILEEAEGLTHGFGAYVIRSLLSEGRLHLGTVSGGEAIEIDKEGPTALFTTTTRSDLDGELETRALSLTLREDAEQSRRIVVGLARRHAALQDDPDLSAWRALQAWLEIAGERRVVIPFAEALALRMPMLSTRVRRDFSSITSLIAASALLHQAQRPRTDEGAIEATLQDYAVVRLLLTDVIAGSQQIGLTGAQHEAIESVSRLSATRPGGVSLADLAVDLGIDKSSASRRIKPLIAEGYLLNLQRRQGLSALLLPGTPAPHPLEFLPSPETLMTDVTVPYEQG